MFISFSDNTSPDHWSCAHHTAVKAHEGQFETNCSLRVTLRLLVMILMTICEVLKKERQIFLQARLGSYRIAKNALARKSCLFE